MDYLHMLVRRESLNFSFNEMFILFVYPNIQNIAHRFPGRILNICFINLYFIGSEGKEERFSSGTLARSLLLLC